MSLAILLGLFLYFHPLGIFLSPPKGRGDSLLLLRTLPVHIKLFGYQASYDELLELYFHSKFVWFLGEYFGWSTLKSFALHNFLAFGLLIVLVYKFTQNKSLSFLILVFSFILFTQRLSLFAGYIENYTYSGLYLLLVLWMCAENLSINNINRNNSNSLYLIIGFLAAWSILHHLITGFMLPGLIYFTWIKNKNNLKGFFTRSIVAATAGFLLIALVLLYFLNLDYSPSLGNAHLSNPPYHHPRNWLSKTHLLNVLNVFLFSSTGLIILLGLIKIIPYPEHSGKNHGAISTMIRMVIPDHISTFLFITLITFWINSFLVRATIGYPADWDMNHFQSIAAGLYTVYRIQYELIMSEKSHLYFKSLLLPVLMASTFVCFSWIKSNSIHQEKSIQNIKISQIIAQSTINEMEKNNIWPLLNDDNRKLDYVSFIIFSKNANEIIKRSGKSIQYANLLQILEMETRQYNKTILLNENEYRIKRQEMYKRLGPLNLKITNLDQDE